VLKLPHLPTSKSVVAVDRLGNARYFYKHDADLGAGPTPRLLEGLRNVDPAAYRWVYLGAYDLLADESGEPLLSWLRQLRSARADATVFVDASKILREEQMNALQALGPHIDYYSANYCEAANTTGKTILNEIAIRLLDAGVRNAVFIKLGELGVYWRSRRFEEHEQGHVVDTVENENGAGDVFSASLLDAIRKQYSLTESVQIANVLAALHVSATDGLPFSGLPINREAVNAFTARRARSGRISFDTTLDLAVYQNKRGFGERYDKARQLDVDDVELWVKRFADWGKIKEDSRVLDAGCGTGRFIIPLQRSTSCRATGVDRSDEMLQSAAAKSGKVQWTKGYLPRLDSVLGGRESKYDCIILSSVLQQLELDDVEATFRHCYDFLEQDGRLLIRTITPDQINSLEWFPRFFPAAYKFEMDRAKPMGTIWRLLEESGFRVVTTELHDRAKKVSPADLLQRLEHKGYSWCVLYQRDEDYQACIDRLRTYYNYSTQVDYWHPAYLVVAEKCPGRRSAISGPLSAAFQQLAAGQARAASETLKSVLLESDLVPHSPAAWLSTFVALRCRDDEGARKYWAAYTDRSGGDSGAPKERELLEAWDSPPEKTTPHPSTYFPTLPTALTGLDRPFSRPASGEPTLVALLDEAMASRTDFGATIQKHADGPEGGCWLRWENQLHQIPKGRIYRLLEYMWSREWARYDDLYDPPYRPVYDDPVVPQTIRSDASELYKYLKRIGIPWRLACNVRSKHITKQPWPIGKKRCARKKGSKNP
jgi:sugar/nucleoside kinase (ribokinase family)/ubiquinone/menaquinone biosynthesis C-methylase UbiE